MPVLATKAKQQQRQRQQLEENLAVSAFLSPKSRIFAGGHARAKTTKQLTPEEVANKIASMLKPGPPFFSNGGNADLIDFISDQSIMNSDALRQQAEVNREARARQQTQATFAVKATNASGGDAEEEDTWDGVGTVWSALDALPAGANWGRIPGAPVSAMSSADMEDDGLWSAITLTCDIECTEVRVGRSVVVPTKVLTKNHYFRGNSRALTTSIGAGVKYSWDDLGKTKTAPASSSASTADYLSLNAYTSPEFTAMWKWPSWMPFFGDKEKKPTAPSTGNGSTGEGLKRIWVPSTTEVSLHATWWGFNIYLPKSVITQLDGDVEEAEKIANLVNKCFTFILNNIPAGLPTALGTVLTILKAIAPVTGYISTFIGWSWDTIKSFDKGQGVILSATWILPVALIPRSLDSPIVGTPSATPPTSEPATPTTPTAPMTTPSEPTAPSAPTAPSTGTPPTDATPVTSPPSDATSGTPDSVTVQATDTPLPVFDDPPLPVGTGQPVPGATLPPTDPNSEPIDLSAPTEGKGGKDEVYPGNPLGRGGDKDVQPPMGNTPPPTRQVPNDAES